MTDNNVIVGVEPSRAEHADAIALGARLARLKNSRLILISVFEPREGPSRHAGGSYEHALRKAVAALADRLEGLDIEQLVVPGASAARVLHHLADERGAQAVVVGSSPHAPWGHVELGHVSERVLHGGAAPTLVAPRGYAHHSGDLQTIGVGFGGTPESDDALRAATVLATSSGAALRVIAVPERGNGKGDLDQALASLDGIPATGELLEGEPAEVLERISAELDILVLGSRSYGPLRAVLLGGVSSALVHRAACPLMVVPHAPDREHEVTLIGGLEPWTPAS
jgi:nucleotide-binding universal stress UspA family protein